MIEGAELMGDMAREPSMEDILSSIRRVIARDEAVARDRSLSARLKDSDDAARTSEELDYTDDEAIQAFGEPSEGVLELGPADVQPPRDDVPPPHGDETLLSAQSRSAARHALGSLSAIVTEETPTPVAPVGSSMRVDDLVLSALRPMLAQWLDQNLPPLVERMVAEEIARISKPR